MKQVWTKHKTNKRDDRDDRDHHYARKVKTHMQQKANNAIDRALKRKDLRSVHDVNNIDDLYQ